MPIARYTQAYMHQLTERGLASITYTNDLDSARYRSRLQNAAARAGLKITTKKEKVALGLGSGLRLTATVLPTPPGQASR